MEPISVDSDSKPETAKSYIDDKFDSLSTIYMVTCPGSKLAICSPPGSLVKDKKEGSQVENDTRENKMEESNSRIGESNLKINGNILRKRGKMKVKYLKERITI